MNTNLIHNILNLVSAMIGALILTDWTAFGFDAATAAKIAAFVLLAQNVVKLVTRDGLSGLVKEQPPVR